MKPWHISAIAVLLFGALFFFDTPKQEVDTKMPAPPKAEVSDMFVVWTELNARRILHYVADFPTEMARLDVLFAHEPGCEGCLKFWVQDSFWDGSKAGNQRECERFVAITSTTRGKFVSISDTSKENGERCGSYKGTLPTLPELKKSPQEALDRIIHIVAGKIRLEKERDAKK